MLLWRCAGITLWVHLHYTNVFELIYYDVREISCRYLRRFGDTAVILRTTGIAGGLA